MYSSGLSLAVLFPSFHFAKLSCELYMSLQVNLDLEKKVYGCGCVWVYLLTF